MIGLRRDEHARIRAAIENHFRGRSDRESERQMRVHLRDCQRCRDHYDDVLGVMSLDPRTPSAEDRLAQGLGLRPAARPRFGTFGLPVLVGAVALGLLALWARPREGGDEDGFTARGGPSSVASSASSALLVYALTPDSRTPRPVEDVFAARDEMAFAYRNPFGKSHLMVFGVDEHDHVYWYHPGWPNPRDNPTAVAIAKAPGLHELPAAVLQAYDGEHLVIHALFTDRELTVRQVEAALAERGAAGKNFATSSWPLSDTVDVTYGVRVAP